MDKTNAVWNMLTELGTKGGITEVIINNIDNVYIEREGELIRLNIYFILESDVKFQFFLSSLRLQAFPGTCQRN